MAAVSPQIWPWGYPSTLSIVGFGALGEMILDDLDWGGATRTRFVDHHFDAAPIGAVSYNYTADKPRLLSGGAGGED